MSKSRADDVTRLSELFKALSNPNRLDILLRLLSVCCPGKRCKTDENLRACVGQLGGQIDISPSTVSHHLKELRRCGLIRMQRRGKNVECWIDPETVRELGRFFGRFA